MPQIPIACTLAPSSADRQLEEWSRLVVRCDRVDLVDDGVRLEVPATLIGAARDLIAREAQCCAFLSFVTNDRADGRLDVTITSANPAGVPVVHLLAGVESS